MLAVSESPKTCVEFLSGLVLAMAFENGSSSLVSKFPGRGTVSVEIDETWLSPTASVCFLMHNGDVHQIILEDGRCKQVIV